MAQRKAKMEQEAKEQKQKEVEKPREEMRGLGKKTKYGSELSF